MRISEKASYALSANAAGTRGEEEGGSAPVPDIASLLGRRHSPATGPAPAGRTPQRLYPPQKPAWITTLPRVYRAPPAESSARNFAPSRSTWGGEGGVHEGGGPGGGERCAGGVRIDPETARSTRLTTLIARGRASAQAVRSPWSRRRSPGDTGRRQASCRRFARLA